MVTKLEPPPGGIPYCIEVATRFSDLDLLGHINNVAMSAMLEDARVRYGYWLGLDGLQSKDGRVVLAAVHVDYVAEARYPALIEVELYLGRLGRTSWETVLLARQGAVTVAASSVIQVYVDETGAPPLPEGIKAALQITPLPKTE
jgi:acyl-CoA thioester hydrolase